MRVWHVSGQGVADCGPEHRWPGRSPPRPGRRATPPARNIRRARSSSDRSRLSSRRWRSSAARSRSSASADRQAVHARRQSTRVRRQSTRVRRRWHCAVPQLAHVGPGWNSKRPQQVSTSQRISHLMVHNTTVTPFSLTTPQPCARTPTLRVRSDLDPPPASIRTSAGPRSQRGYVAMFVR